MASYRVFRVGVGAYALFLLSCGGGISQEAWNEGMAALAATPSGTARLISVSVAPGSTLVARAMGASGQQVPELWATVGVTLAQDLPSCRVEVAFAAGPKACLTSSEIKSLRANTESQLTLPSVSRAGTDIEPVCRLPYTTTAIYIWVYGPLGQDLFSVQLPATYTFIAPQAGSRRD